MPAHKCKKPKVAKDDDHVDRQLVLSIEKLQEIQDELEKVQGEEKDKVLELQQKYNDICRPVYDRRNEIIKAIPNLWFTAFKTHPVLSDLLTEKDKKILEYLNSLDVKYFNDMNFSFSIKFGFKENPYFENVELTKTSTFYDDGTAKIVGTDIKWKKGMSAKKRGRKGKKQPLSDESFFNWFGESQENNIAHFCFDKVAEVIKDDLWLDPLNYIPSDGEEDDDYDDDDDDDNDEL